MKTQGHRSESGTALLIAIAALAILTACGIAMTRHVAARYHAEAAALAEAQRQQDQLIRDLQPTSDRAKTPPPPTRSSPRRAVAAPTRP